MFRIFYENRRDKKVLYENRDRKKILYKNRGDGGKKDFLDLIVSLKGNAFLNSRDHVI